MSNIIFMALRRLRRPLILLIMVYAIATLGMTMIPGVDDQGNVWHMSFFHAFYFVSFMGSTIGFGEIPYPFTDTQRLWVLCCIYISVVAWLYAIGNMLSLVQDPAFRHAVTYQAFTRTVKRFNSPFYIICGYGDTGKLLAQGLTDLSFHVVVLDANQETLNQIQLSNFPQTVISLKSDVTTPENLLVAGIKHKHCAGVISVTEDDHTNLKVAVTSKLLNSQLPVVCRSEINDEANNMQSFGTDNIINPFDTFAEYLALAMHNPVLYVIQNWLISQHNPQRLWLTPPKGRWIICGYGRFGKAVHAYLKAQGASITIIDENPSDNKAPRNTIIGRGTEANTLHQANITEADGIVVASNDDANNLSTLITAKELNNTVFTIGRVNREENDLLFVKAKTDLIMRRSQIVANLILTRISKPLVNQFLKQARSLPQETLEQLVTDIRELTHYTPPVTWRLTINEKYSPAIRQAMHENKKLQLHHLGKNLKHKEKANCLALMLKREDQFFLLPPADTEILANDQILFCGTKEASAYTKYIANNIELLEDKLGSSKYYIPLLKWLKRREK